MKRTVGRLALFLAAATFFSLATPLAAMGAEGSGFYSLPPATHARSITNGPEGSIWFSASGPFAGGAKIGQVDQAGQTRTFSIPPRREIGQIVAGPDGKLWFTEEYANRRGYLVGRIGRISPTGEYVEYTLGNHVGGVASITPGPGEALWFTNSYVNHGRHHAAVGRIGPSGEVRRFPLAARSGPGAIVAGPDGNLWFGNTAHGAPSIARFSPDGQISQFPLLDRRRLPDSIAVGPDGNLWFGEVLTGYRKHPTNRIGRITTAGSITEFRVPGTYATTKVTAGPDGDVWFATQVSSNLFLRVDSITPNGVVGQPACLQGTSCELVPDALTSGPDGALWFSASRFYPHSGGGESGIMETQEEEQESGFVGRYAPPAETIAREP